ncbi:immunoglobulin-like domain-containing protein [uncultured Aquimarina sp.]|uniref:immunoglobulin-like domain-containing protein n=1 Tax=uncultured Aquimarina sp. TaxID=575652 RepID=UPI00261FAF0F|nr:immunoglobulin-like domain-containing protein [uncultured Aquimarina sp.]
MKHNYYRFIKNLTLTLALVSGLISVQAQDILFTFANAQNTNDGVDDFYEVDVFIESTVDFKLGSGQLYFNYNSEAFGINIDGDPSAVPPIPDVSEYIQPSSSITGAALFGGVLNVYNGFVDNNNTDTRYSVSFQQGVNVSLMDTQSDVTSTPKLLFHLKIKYQDITKDPMFTFEEAALFGGQFVIACEGIPCSGTVISAANDTFDSSGAEIDTTPPVITLLGNATETVEAGSTYADAGATALDNVDGDITANIVIANPVDTAVPGVYTVTYNVSDAVGNAAVEVTREVTVVDTTAPIIVLNGSATITVEAGSTYTDAGATASDIVDGDLTANIVMVNPVDTSIPGVYTVTYNVSDAATNAALEVTREVTVSDTTAPVIALDGLANVAVEAGSTYTDAGATASDSFDGDLTASIAVVNPVNTSVPGVYTVTYNVSDAAMNAAVEVTREVTVSDTTIPVVALNGSATITIEAGSTYADAGATASDSFDGDLTASIVVVNPVNTSVPGVYTVTYNVSDAAMNAAVEVTREVTVSDTTIPVIALNSSATVTVEAGSAYTDAGATANDSFDGNITANIVTVNPVNTSVAGVYTVTYNVSDAAGNNAVEVTREVTVTDTTVPVITVLGSPIEFVEAGSTYTDAGATASDSFDGNITANIVTVNPVNTSIPGSYTVTYNVSDAAGNAAAQQTRLVFVQDDTPPVIALNGAATITVEAGSTYMDAGATASDSFDGDITADIVTVNPVNTAVPGVYTITYNVSDAAMNAAVEVTREVTVSDTTIPVIALNGSATVTVEAGSTYADTGATASDSFDGDITVDIVTVNPVNTSVPGMYTVTYNVEDNGGNMAVEVTREVNVIDTTAPVIIPNGVPVVTVEAGNAYVDAGATASDIVDGDLTASIVVINSVNTLIPGSYSVTYDVADAAGNDAIQIVRIVNVVDTTAPVISLTGANPQTIELGTGYSELGATTDDGSAVVIDASAFMDAVGSYNVTYNATDASGNNAIEIVRVVNVIDTTAPIITLTGANPQTIQLGTGYSELGATTDDGSAVVIDASAFVDAVGSYNVTYNATDASGNNAVEVVRIVNVVDTAAPIISLTGANPQMIERGNSYSELGATTNDGSAVVIDASAVNTNITGSYNVTYNATDAFGNNAIEVIRIVNVVDTTAPIITLTGANPQTIQLGAGYSELGATTDDGSAIVIDASAFMDAVGSYNVTYNATDASGNNAVEVVRTVNIVDVTGPIITLIGANPQTIELGAGYSELGATTNDGSAVVIDASAFMDAVGSYNVTYNAVDASGNNAVEVVRTVNVVDTTAPIISLIGANPQEIELGAAYSELGATTDDGSAVVIDASAVDINIVGSYSVTYNATDASGNNAVEVIRTVNVVPLLSVEDNELALIKLYPNPVSDRFVISGISQQVDAVAIYSMEGRLVKSIDNYSSETINVAQLQGGVYLVRITLGSAVKTIQFLKKN